MHPEIANDNVNMLEKSKPYQLSSSKKLDIQKKIRLHGAFAFLRSAALHVGAKMGPTPQDRQL